MICQLKIEPELLTVSKCIPYKYVVLSAKTKGKPAYEFLHDTGVDGKYLNRYLLISKEEHLKCENNKGLYNYYVSIIFVHT